MQPRVATESTPLTSDHTLTSPEAPSAARLAGRGGFSTRMLRPARSCCPADSNNHVRVHRLITLNCDPIGMDTRVRSGALVDCKSVQSRALRRLLSLRDSVSAVAYALLNSA